MLRLLALVLVLANALLLAAQLGVFEPLTAASNTPRQREPERLQRQVHPEWVQILSADAASAALRAAAASATSASATAQPGACLEAGPFADSEAEAAQRTLRDAGIAAAAWQAIRTEDDGAYIIYMGRYPDRELLLRKQEQLKRLKLPTEELRDNAALQPGLSLGRFDSQPAADAALARMVQRGLRTARVVTVRPAQSQTLLRVPAADATLRARLAGLKMPSGPGFGDCAAQASAAAASQPGASAAAPGWLPRLLRPPRYRRWRPQWRLHRWPHRPLQQLVSAHRLRGQPPRRAESTWVSGAHACMSADGLKADFKVGLVFERARGKGASGQAAALHCSGRRCAPTALRCAVLRPVAELATRPAAAALEHPRRV